MPDRLRFAAAGRLGEAVTYTAGEEVGHVLRGCAFRGRAGDGSAGRGVVSVEARLQWVRRVEDWGREIGDGGGWW